MVYWIRKTAMLMGYTVFFGVLFFSLADSSDPFDLGSLIMCIVKALIGGGVFWFTGYILGDIIFKGILTDLEVDKANLLEGGLVQRINEKHENELPGGPDMPLIDAETGYSAQKIKTAENKLNKSRGA